MNPGERYQLLEKIAAGSFATVYRAQDLELRREVAVKQIHEQFLGDPQQLERYWGEAQLLASLQHPNIVTIYDIVREKGWLIMELMQANLADRQAGRPMDLVSLRTVLAHCLRALKFLHEHGIVHGDIKPSNLMIDRRKRIKLGDFGLARRVSDEEGSLVKGTTKYMAPEVVSDEFGDVGPASDLYSLGFAAYELMCGDHFETLFPGLSAHGRDKQLAWIMWHAAKDRRLPPIARVLEGVPEDLAKVIEKLAAKNPAQRYASADAALADLNVDLRVIKADGNQSDSPKVDPAARRRQMIIIGAFACSVLMSLFVYFSGGEEAPKPKAKSGLIRNVKLAERELVVEDEETGIPEVIKLGDKPSLFLKNTRKKILLEEVHEEDRVRIVLNGKNVEFILMRPIQTRGRILRIDNGAKILVLHTDEESSREDIPIHIGPHTKLKLNQDDVRFNDLQDQDRVDVLHLPEAHNENQQVALSVDARRSIHATGFVRSVNVPGHQMSFDVRQGATTRLLQLPFSKTCSILLPNGSKIDGKELKAEDLQAADRISVDYDTEITKIEAKRNKTLTGVIKAVNTEAQTVDVQASDRKQHTFHVSPQTEIDIAGESAKLEELRESDETRVSFEDADDGSGSKAVTIDATRPIKHDRTVIVIGVQHFTDKSVTQVDYVLNDVQMLADALRHRYCVAPERLKLLKDANRAQIEQGIQTALKDVLLQTQVLVIFEGQAYADGDEYYLAGHDFQLSKPAETGISLKWLIETLENSVSSEKLLILDTFQVGTLERYAPQPSPKKMLQSFTGSMKTLQAIAARGDNELGQLWPEKSHGSFAWEAALGIKGAADTNRDLHLDSAEFIAYLRDAMSKVNFDKARPQTPELLP
ncbi:MAG: pknB 1 [Planctomycetaceae bacterium]|nr:pknB 1 [Planctomycetaceae bacterium]